MEVTTIIYFPGFEEPADRLAYELGCVAVKMGLHHFPDGESLVRLPARLQGNVVIYVSLDHPDSKLVPLGFAAATARDLGADTVNLVAPYLCYMRQDMAFNPGEAVSQRIVGQWLGQWFDYVFTVDAHLHRVHSIRDVVPCGVNISAAPLMAEFLKQQGNRPVLLGPDEESLQWVQQIGTQAGLDFGVARKQRRGDRDVEITLPDLDLSGREVVIIDDVLSSGFTVARTARQVVEAGASRIQCMVTHALFAPGAEELLSAAGIESVISSDTILHPTNAIFMAPGLAAAIGDMKLSRT